jgi:hypothetical protein
MKKSIVICLGARESLPDTRSKESKTDGRKIKNKGKRKKRNRGRN